MRKQKYNFVLLLIFIFLVVKSTAQCPGCITDMNFTVNPAAPAITPDTLPTGVAGQYYEEDINIYLPAQFQHSSGTNVTLTKLEVLSVSGLPFGLNFQSSSSNNTFFPSQNPPTTEHGCARVCGTPVFPGQYSMVVFVRAYVNTIIGNQTSDDSFILPITILPGSSGNASFSAINTTGCGSVTASFQTNLPSNGKPGFSYAWNFGNGTTSTLENPLDATYTTPGQYQVSCQTTIDTLPFRYLNTITVLSTSCTDISSKPDLYIKVKDLNDNALFQGTPVANTNPPVTFNLPNVQINHNQSYIIEVWDEDTGLESPDDNCANFQIMGNTNNITLTSGGNSIGIVIEKPLFVYNDTVLVTVYALPPKPEITAFPSTDMCVNDSILLVTNALAGVQWYNDTSMVMGASGDSLYVFTSGKYFVVITDSIGCQSQSDTMFVAFHNNPPKPTFWRQGDTLRTLLAGFGLQWYFEGDPILGATTQNCHIFAAGLYHLVATSDYGCLNTSDAVYYQPFNNSIYRNDFVFNYAIFPNPNDGHFYIEYHNLSASDIRIAIFDITGRRIFERNVPFSKAYEKIPLNLALKPSVYIMEISTTTQVLVREKLVVQ